MRKFITLIFYLIIANYCFSQDTTKNQNTFQTIIIKIPVNLYDPLFKWKRYILYSLESEIQLKKNRSFTISTGFMPRVKGGYFLMNNLRYPRVVNGYAIEFNGIMRFYLTKRKDRKYNLQGFYIAPALGNVFSINHKSDGSNFNTNFIKVYGQFGWQKSFNKFNVDVPFSFGYYKDINFGKGVWVYTIKVSLGIKIK